MTSSSSASSISGISRRSNGVGSVSTVVVDTAPMTAPPSRTAGQDGNDHGLDHAVNGMAPMPLPPSIHSAQQTGGATPDTTEGVVGTSIRNESEGLDLLRAFGLDAEEPVNLLDTVDALLADVVCEGLEQTSSEEDITEALLGDVLSEGFEQTSIGKDGAPNF